MATGPIPFASDPADLSRPRSQTENAGRSNDAKSSDAKSCDASTTEEETTTTVSDADTAIDAIAKRKMANGTFVAAAFVDAGSSRDDDDDDGDDDDANDANDDDDVDDGNGVDATTTSMGKEETMIISFLDQSSA